MTGLHPAIQFFSRKTNQTVFPLRMSIGQCCQVSTVCPENNAEHINALCGENKGYAPHYDVSINDGPHTTVVLYYNNRCITIAYSIQYSNMLYRFVA